MPKRRTVVILGRSLLIAGLATNLRRQEEALQVLQIEGSQQDLASRVAALHPDAIILDLEAPEAHQLFDLLRACPGQLFIGLSMTSNTVLVLSSQVQVARSANDLVQTIERELGRLE